MEKIGIVGCGALGSMIARELQTMQADYQLIGIVDRNLKQAQLVAELCGTTAYESVEALLAQKPDYVIEVAGVEAAKAMGAGILRRCHLVLVSIGAMANEKDRNQFLEAAKASGHKIYVVNGAIGGLDVMRTFCAMGEVKASIENKKAPESLEGAPYLQGRLLSKEQEETIFTGSVDEAIAGFPKNVNVAVSTALASEDIHTQVIIQSVPHLEENCHMIRLETEGARAEISVFSKPDPHNPKSSTSTAYSVIALLKNLASPIVYF